MAIKYREAEELRLSTRKSLTANPENWMRFLRTASNTYKYSYQDQLMITAQFPQATAVAAFDVWSDRFGRRIRSGEKGIGLIDDSGTYPKMKYVFDISQSVRYRDVPQPYVWELREEYQEEAALYLAGDLSVPIEQAVSDFCENTVDSLIGRYENDIIFNARNSVMLAGLDDTSIKADFRQTILESVKYMALTRCGLEPSGFVDNDVFRNLYSFSDVQITDILGWAVSDISEQVLREIETTVKTIERRNQYEHNIEENQNNRRSAAPAERGEYDILSDSQGGQADRFDIYSRSRNIRVPSEPDRDSRSEERRQMGTETQKVSEGKQTDNVSADVRRAQSDGSPDRSERSGGKNDGRSDRSNDAAGGRDGAAESSQSNGVGTQSELYTEQSGRNSAEQSDLRITDKPKRKRRTKKKAEEPVSPVFFPFPVGEQMSLFAPEQTEQDRANEYAMSKIISHGTAFEDGKFRIAEYFSEQHTKEEKAKFLSDEYGWGGYAGGSESMDYRPNKGITMSYTDKDNPENNITVHLTYPQLADMIDFLISNDMYITPADIEKHQQRAIHILKTYDTSNSYEEAQIEKAKRTLEGYNIDYSQLLASQPEVETVTPEQVEEMNTSIPDDTEIPDIDAPAVPIEQEESIYSESAVVAEFRNKTIESFHLIGDRTEFDIELEVEELLRQEMIDNEIAGDIEAVVLYGSRSRGLETSEDTDIDIVVQINNAELKEDALFNLFSDMDIEIDGIPVDVNPIRPEETGTLDEYLPKAEAYLEQKQAERAAQIFSSSVDEQPQVGLEVPDDSTEQVQTINPEDIKIGDKFEYNGDEYTVRALQGDQPDTVKVSYMAKQSHNQTEYEVITNIDKYVLAEQGIYQGNDEYVIDDPAITIEKYGYTIDFNRIAEIRFTRETETYLGGLDSDGHERKDNFGVSEEDTSFYLSDGYLMKYESDYGDFFPVTKERAAEDIEELIHRALTTPDMSIRITDREGNISYLDRESFTITDEAEMSLETPDENEALIVEPQVIEDRVSVEIGLSESPIIDDLNERIANSPEPLTFAAVNAAFEYLDQKQHLERLDPLLKAGWYKKTDFTITAVIDGEEYSYSGRFDIGDGKGQGGGSLIDHISAYVDYTLSMTNPFHLSDEELAERQKIRDIVIPFLREHEELTQADQLFLNRLKYSYPTRVSKEQYQSLVGKTVDYNGRQYVVDRVDIGKNKAHIRDDNTGWYPLFQDVELRDIVGQNIDLILDEKEQFFRDCDLPALLAKSSLAWDEIESLGYIFYEQGYIDRVKPTDAAHFGNGYFAETEAFELARRYHGGEDITRELAEKLFLHKNKNAPLTSIPFEDSYVEDLELDIRQTDAGLFVSYGAYSREVTFEEIGRAYLNYFAVENEAIRKEAEREETEIAARKALKELGYEFDINGDKFFFTETGVERIYYVLDGTESGHFVVSEVSYEDILRADDDVKSINDRAENTKQFFSKLTEYSAQTTVDVSSPNFSEYVERFNRPHDASGTSWFTLIDLHGEARRRIENASKITSENSQPEKSVGTFKIYQLKSGEEYHFKRFEGLERQPEPVSISDYNLVYEGSLADIESGEDLSEKLEAIFSKFNTDRPEDFTGHSLSVSDVVVIEQDGQQQAHFVDSVGFQEVPDFFAERTQKAEQTPEQPIEAEQPEEVKLKSIVIDLRPKSVIEAERADQQTRESTPEEADNYRITDLSLGQRKTAVKFEDNLAAIRTLKQLEAEDRDATPEEQEILSKYTGWGGMAKVFEPENRHYQEVRELLTDDEFEAARKSTMTAFYTSPVIIKEMYAKLAEMGMNGGRLLEPSCGIGNFIGMIPGSNTRVTGIELDSLTGRIAQKLYPQAQIQVCGFEHSKLKENSFDVAVGNVPFGDIHLYDKKYNPHNLLIHDYFFSKSLDMVKPGGVVAFITSKGTLDKLDPTARRLLADKAEFLGAVRLPNNAFKANAGTEVTSDIIFLQKRAEPVVIEPDKEPLWIRTSTDSNGIEMNAYFATHPEQICGTMTMVSGPFGMESTCEPNRDVKLSEQLKAALSNIQGKIETVTITAQQEPEYTPIAAAPESLRNCSYFLSDGKPFFYESGESTPIEFPKTKAKKNLAILTEMDAIRDTVRQLLDMQLDESVSDDEIKAVQATLSAMYDKFAEKYGRINDKANADVMKGDSSLPLLKSLERFDEKGQYIGKADIFSKRTIKAEHIVTEVSTSVDALAVSLSSEITKGKVDLDYMSQLTGFDKEKIISDLQGVIFKLPDTDTYVPADEYLSGNIRQKLETAQQAFNTGDTSLAVNITALQKAMPERLEASSIDVRLGSTWIKPEYIRDFVYQLVNTPNWHKSPYSQSQFIDVQYSPISGAWTITNKGTDKWNVQATTTYGTSDRTAYELIEDALNLKATTVKVKVEVDGKERYVVDATKTAQARAKQELIMQKFKEWIFADKSRRDDLVETYNRQFNSSRPREYDGSHLNFVGMNPEITLRQHQLNAVARCLYGGNTLLAHEVGAGKTFEMIAAAMEGKRLGLHSKSLICVPNHLTEQIGSDFIKLYPNANILVATKKDFEKENRRALMAKIATGNYDAIIIGHSQLEKIPISQERQQQYIREQIEETMRNIEELKAMNGERYQIKQAEKTKANLEAKLQKLLDSPKDDTVTFEELGIDKLFVDEAHLFKNLFLSTKMQNVSGISTSSDVQKTADLFMKTKYMDEITGGKGIVFATGTPISNTMCEIYNMMRYLQMDKLREMHLEHFDAWASTFGENVTQMELTPEGNSYRAKTRFSKFFNLPELMAMFKECADIQTADTLNLPGIPECEVHNVAVEPSEVQKDLVDALSKRAEAIHNRQVDPSTDNMLKITTDGRKIGLDQRLINPDLPDEPGSKVNTCIDNVFRIWTDTAEIRGTQLVFCDFSTPKNDGSFNVYDDIKQKLIAKGVPEEQIAFIHDATNEAKREELFSKVRSGEIRVLIGSTSKMGAGTNVQDRLVASHDLDAPYRPADMEQRRGRMVRQGNKNSKVHLYRYCTKDTFDAYLFQMLERKQSFISQIMTSKSPQRRCDDIDEATLSYAEVKALCVGDPRIKEKMELDNEVGKLRLERSSHQQEQYRLEDMAEDIRRKIGILETNIPKNQNDFLFIQSHPTRLDKDGKKIFEGITLHGKLYTDKKEAAEAFKTAYMTAIRQGGGHRDYVPVGEYRGFKVAVLFDSFSQTYKASLSREGTYHLDLGTDNFTRMDNVLDKMESLVTERVGRLNEHKKQLKEVTDQIGKAFPKEAEFQAKTTRLAVLNAELDTDGKKNEQGGITQDDTPPTQSAAPKR